MSYLVLARKFRPQTFDELIGQDAIVRTLKNAIQQERLAQSFLFVGMRGVGKTSTARILAKSLNCEKGPTPTPCGKCAACKEITEGNSLDVLEIDGASNRGIDEIRNLRENVKFKPTRGQFRIYIIDEVHMLTSEAFNALLKTLEEPPAHVKFIFATTEAHKVPATILSRCQRFDFKRIALQTLVDTLKAVAKKEKIEAEEEVFFLLAKAADGSLRDGESLLDKLASFSKGKIKAEQVFEALGWVAQDIYWKLIDACAQENVSEVLKYVEEVIASGKDLYPFLEGLIENLRHLLILESVEKGEAMLELSKEEKEVVIKRKGRFSRAQLVWMLSILQSTLLKLRRTSQPRYVLELALVKVASSKELVSLSELNAKLEKLEQPTSQSTSAPVAPRPTLKATPSRPAPLAAAKPQVQASVATETIEEAPVAIGASSVELNEFQTVWPRILEAVKAKKVSTGIFLSEAEPVEVSGGRLTIAFPQEFVFHKETVEKKENRTLIEAIIAQELGQPLRLQCAVARTSGEEKTVAKSTSEVPDIVESAIEMFQGKIIRRSL